MFPLTCTFMLGVGKAYWAVETVLAPLDGADFPPYQTRKIASHVGVLMSDKESGVDRTKQQILLGYCLGGPHGQFGCLGGSGYLPCSQIKVENR